MSASDVPSQKAPRKRRSPADGPRLTRELILSAALEYIDDHGLEAFSLRNLADKLGVYPTAIYWHVPTRGEILGQVVALVTSAAIPKSRRRSWKNDIRDLFYAYRDVLRRHPNIAPLIGAQMSSNTSMNLDLVEHVLYILDRAGVSGPAVVGTYNSIIAALVGFATQEFSPAPQEDVSNWQALVQKRLIDIDRKLYPHLCESLPLLSNRAFILRWENGTQAPLDASYDLYVQIIISGIEEAVINAQR